MGVSRGIRTVLVVDDDERVIAGFRRRIEPARVALGATDAAAALALARRERPELAIVDLWLGKESGIDVIAALKRRQPTMLAILISGWASIDGAVVAAHAGADHVLAKPVTFPEIISRLEGARCPPARSTPTLAKVEWEHISRVLTDSNGNLSLAARRLGIYRSTLQRRLRKFAPRT